MLNVFMVLAAMMSLVGCATYGANGIMPDLSAPESLKDKAKMSTKLSIGAAMSAYPIITEDESKKFFDEDLIEKKILAIAMEIRLNEPVNLVAAALNLEGAEGTTFSPMTSDEVYSVVKRSWIGRSAFWMVFVYYVGAPISAYATSKTNDKIQQDLVKNKKLLTLGKVDKGLTRGFLCFRIPVSPEKAKGKLKLIIQNDGKLLDYNFDINP